MKIWLDDVRPAPAGYVRLRTCQQFIEFYADNWHMIATVSFDHDLGEDANGVVLQTGYDALKWLEEQVANGNMNPPLNMQIHSANPVGRKNMAAAICKIESLIDN
jgi:hypothetical protein